MSLDPRGRTTDGGQQQQSARSWSWSTVPARGTSDERQAAASGGGATTSIHNNSSAVFNGAALLLDAAARAGGELSTPADHDLVAPMPTHIITSKQQKAMTSKAKVMNKNVSETTINVGNPTSTAIMTDGSARDGDDMLGHAGDPPNKLSSRLYATVHPGFWRIEGKHTAKILVKIRMKVSVVGCY